MKRLLLTILLLALCSQANAVGVVHTVSSLTPPLVVPATWAGDTIRFTGNLSSASGAAITFQSGANNVVIDGQGDTIRFGTNGNHYPRTSGQAYGITTGAAEISGLYMRDLTIMEDIPTDSIHIQPLIYTPEMGTWAKCFRISNVKNSLIENCNFYVEGGNAQCIWADGTSPTRAGYNVLFRNCNIEGRQEHFRDRQYWEEVALIHLHAPQFRTTEPDFQFHYRFVSCSTLYATWSNIHWDGVTEAAVGGVAGYSLVVLDSNRFFVDARNDNNPITAPGWGTSNSGECYGVSIRLGDQTVARDRSRITNNRFDAGTANAGGHGIFISGTDGADNNDSLNCIYVRNNVFNLHHGPDLGSSFSDGYGMKIREDASGIWIEGNTFTLSGDNSDVTTAWGPNVIGIELNTPWNGDVPMTISNSIRNIRIRNNTITAFNAAPGLNAYGTPNARCFQFSEYFTSGTYNNVVDSNTLTTNGVFYEIAEYNGAGGGGNTTVRANSHSYYGGTSPNDGTTFYFFSGRHGSSTLDGRGWVFLDGTFSNGVSDTHGSINAGDLESGLHNATVKYTYVPQVLGSDGRPVRDVTVNITNRFGLTVGSGLTGPNGRVNLPVAYYFDGDHSQVDTATYSPFTIQATKGTDTRTVVHTLAWNNRTPTITLLATVGADSIAPFVEYFTEDSVASLSATATIGIPRFQIAPLDSAGWLTAFVPPGYAEGGFTYEMYTTKNLDTAAWSDRWLNLAYGGNGSSRDFDHMHLSVYHDTIYGGCDVDDRYLMWELRGDSLWKIYSALWPVDSWTLIPAGEKTTLHNWAAWRLPASDSVLGFGRFSDEPKTGNVSWALSTDKGQTYGQASYFPNGNWSTFSGGNIRYGGGIFNNTVFAGYVRVLSGAGYLNWWEWNRATSTWTDLGHAIDMTTGAFHAIALGVTDTMRFAAQTKDGALVGGQYRDSIYSARRGKNTASWTQIPAVYAGNRGGTGQTSPYVALTHVRLTDRIIMFHSWCEDNTNAGNAIAMRQWSPSTNRWSDPPIIVSRGQNAWKVTTAFETPSSHGDVAYAQMICDSTIGSTTYRFSYIIRVTFSGALPDVEPPAAIDTFAVVHDTSFSESYNLAAVVITFDPIPPLNFTYQYTTANGTATAGQDYVTTAGTALMNPPHVPPIDPDNPDSYKDTIYIPLLVDPNDEPDEIFTFHITSTNPPNWEGPTSDLTCQIFILDNDEPVALGERRNRRVRK